MKKFTNIELDTTYLPKRDDETYSDIENFQYYELKNNLIFELVLRTKEYTNLQEMKKYERVTVARSIGFSDEDSKYAGLPWMFLKLMIQKDYIDKKGQVFDIKMFFFQKSYDYELVKNTEVIYVISSITSEKFSRNLVLILDNEKSIKFTSAINIFLEAAKEIVELD